MNKLYYFLGFLLISVNLLSQISIYNKAVVFIQGKNKLNEITPLGTAFFLQIMKDSVHGKNYLVTAKHVLQKDSFKNFYDTIVVRINNKSGSFSTASLPIITTGPNKNVFTHSDSSVDLAVIPISIGDDVDFNVVPASFLLENKEDFNFYVKEGTGLFYTGMFTPYLGYKKNYPIIRFGRVCLITDEKILWDSLKNDRAELFLAETMTYGGNSGSPVYLDLTVKPRKFRLKVVGEPSSPPSKDELPKLVLC